MASRLFKAVVGCGITLGTASAACLGQVSEATSPVSVDGPEGSSTPPGASPGEPATDAGARADGAVAPGPTDAGADVFLTAFCDASWPTTKGNPSGATCGDVAPCTDAGFAPHCVPTVSPGTCASHARAVAYCVNGAWQCSTGAVPSTDCKCWEGAPCTP